MSNKTEFAGSPEFEQFILLAIGMGLDNLQSEGSLIPMIVSNNNGEYSLCVLTAEANQVMDAAANHIGNLPAGTDYYALVFSGKVDVEGLIANAVIAQAGDRGSTHGHVLFQKYDPQSYGALGAPEYGGIAAQFLSP
jgi:hypothetical protein